MTLPHLLATRIFWNLTLAAVLSAPSLTAAQAPERPAQQGRGNRGGAVLTNAQLATMLDAYAIVQAQDQLQLNDAQYGQFVSRLKRLQDTRRKNTQARNRMIQELRRLTTSGTPADESLLRDRLKALREHDEQSAAALRREHDALDEVLDPRQQALFRIFEERLERQKLDLLVRARERAARAAPARKPGGGT